MKRIEKQQLGILLTAMAVLVTPFQAAAGTPEFARSAQEWEKLRDDVIEYEEISALIHEYNATAKKNQIDLNQFRKDYGETNDEWADRYRELADELESSLDYPDIDDSNYASVMSNIVTSEMQIDAWRETADDALEDYQSVYYDTCLAECQLVSQAQTYYIDLYEQQLQQENDEKNLELLQEQFESMEKQCSLGLATEAERLALRESLRNAEKVVQDDKAAIKNLHDKMIIMLGWKQDADPEICELSEEQFEQRFERIQEMNPDEDKIAAIENSYTMKSNKKKWENARSSDAKETLEETIREDEQSIGAELTAAYQNILAYEAAYDLKLALEELEQDNKRRADVKYELGKISKLEWLSQEIAYVQASGNAVQAKLQLFEAIESYDLLLHGLAGAS